MLTIPSYISLLTLSVEEKSFAVAQIEPCVHEIGCWMRANKLKINSDNSEVLIVRKNLTVY